MRSTERLSSLTRFFGSGVSALTAALLVAALIAGPARAAFPGSNGKIAYGGYGPSGIYRINPDGSNNELVKSGNVYNPVWSSDGTKIAYLDSGTQTSHHGRRRHGLDPGLHLRRQRVGFDLVARWNQVRVRQTRNRDLRDLRRELRRHGLDANHTRGNQH